MRRKKYGISFQKNWIVNEKRIIFKIVANSVNENAITVILTLY